MLILAAGTVFLTIDDEPEQIDPERLLQEIIQPTRYVTCDQVAKMIIKGDPSLLLIDVRGEEEFQEYSLTGCINIPLENLLDEDNLAYLGIPGTKVVFVSNDDIRADQTWVLTKRLGFNSTYVMRGGLNSWMETIIDPQKPDDDASYVEFETYSFRKGAQTYFIGSGMDESDNSKVEVQVRRREKTDVAAGGC